MRIVAIQLDVVWEEPQANFARVRELLSSSVPERGALVVLPELFACGFSMNVDRVGEDEPRATELFLRDVAREFEVFVVGGVAARSNGRVRNEAVVTNPAGEIVSRYAKLHPFSPAGENEAYAAGNDVVVFKWQDFDVAPFVCYDLRFPEVFRRATCRGANMFVVIANWPTTRIAHWITLLQARAIESEAYAIGVNRCGRDPNQAYPGRSLVVDPHGKVIADAGDGEKVVTAEVDIDVVRDVRRSLPFLADMRENFITSSAPPIRKIP